MTTTTRLGAIAFRFLTHAKEHAPKLLGLAQELERIAGREDNHDKLHHLGKLYRKLEEAEIPVTDEARGIIADIGQEEMLLWHQLNLGPLLSLLKNQSADLIGKDAEDEPISTSLIGLIGRAFIFEGVQVAEGRREHVWLTGTIEGFNVTRCVDERGAEDNPGLRVQVNTTHVCSRARLHNAEVLGIEPRGDNLWTLVTTEFDLIGRLNLPL